MSAAEPEEGNKLVFKPSPLLAREKRRPGEGTHVAGPLEVTAVPLSSSAVSIPETFRPGPSKPPAAAQPLPERRHQDDLTKVSLDPIQAPPARPAPRSDATGEVKDRSAAGAGDRPAAGAAAEEQRERLWTYVIIAGLAVATLAALYWLGLF